VIKLSKKKRYYWEGIKKIIKKIINHFFQNFSEGLTFEKGIKLTRYIYFKKNLYNETKLHEIERTLVCYF
jgi:hypothetical protein